MYRKLLLAMLAVVLAAPLAARAHDDELDAEWGWIDEGGDVVEEYDFAPGESVSFDTFQEGLNPYGQWVTVGAYGRVWRPAGVATGWRPYFYGSWSWTDEGWLWVSSEPWGWATYHYGRWAYDGFYGWVWVPGYQWAPAWVSWRYGPDYIGWAPLGPGLSVYVTNYPVVYDHWCFVPSARFVGYPVHSIAYVGPRVRPIYTRTQPAPPRSTVHGAVAPAWGGPARPFVEQRVGRPIAAVRVQAVASPRAAAAAPTRDGVVNVYRPEAARPSRGSGAATRSGAVTAPGRGNSVSPLPGNRNGNAGTVAPSPGGPARPRGGGASQAAPARPEGARGSGSAVQAPPPATAPAPVAPAPRHRSDRSSDADDPSSGGRGGSAAPPPRDYGGGGREAAPARPSRGDFGGGGGGAARGGGGGGSVSRGGGQGGGHATPNRR